LRISTRCSPTELEDPRPRVDGHAVALPELDHPRLDAPRIDSERPAVAGAVAERDVLGDGERLDEAEVLVHHPDPGVERVARASNTTGSP
jgi:hypothetical protein